MKKKYKITGSEKYYIEGSGDEYQSVFPASESEKSQLHSNIEDAYKYMREECGVTEDIIIVIY